MEDMQIIDLYWARSENAIVETGKKYGVFCHNIAKNILSLEQDAEECVNDTYYQAWKSMPSQRPEKLRAWLGKVVRNIALNLWNKNHAQKRYAGMEELLNELEDCIPSGRTVEDEIAEKELTEFLDEWLKTLSCENRILFMRRYWYGEALNVLAREQGLTPKQMAKHMFLLRQKLKNALESEGYKL